MVILMLDHASSEARVRLTMGLEVGIQILDGDRRWARDLLIDTRDAETTLILGEGIFTALDDASIDKGLLEPLALGEHLCHRIGIDDEEADGTPDLRSSQADTIREIHGLPHIFDEGTQAFVVGGNILPDLTQDGVSIYIYR